MTETDTSILDELRQRNRRTTLRQRGQATGRVQVSTPRPLGRRKPKPRVYTPRGPDMRNSAEAKAKAKETIEARREREGDEMCEAVLAVLQRLASDK